MNALGVRPLGCLYAGLITVTLLAAAVVAVLWVLG